MMGGVKLSGPVDWIGLKKKKESGTDLNSILRCLLSFRTVVTSRNILVSKIIFPTPKNGFPSQSQRNGPRSTGCPIHEGFKITGGSKIEKFLGMVVEQEDKCIKIHLDRYVKEVIAEEYSGNIKKSL
jgi:hypothetical protein